MYRYFIAVLLGVAAMACDTSTSTPPETDIGSLDGLPTDSFLLDPIGSISSSNLDVNKYPFNEPDKLSVPTMCEFQSANIAAELAIFKAIGTLDMEKDKELWDASINCAGVLTDLRARDIYLREILPKIESEGIDAWEKTCDEWIMKAVIGAQ
ncbi:uncharacterized protein FTJAE_13769 [Fusarium tjaetaba]|uniref:Uncharacterized protein n=1 Tax=Fusarium tjaetaba TaxID=1567544 RepID=A0A8H5VAG1_9HYPO|nr:uncharacterized protein FTJAE_13769 [Fusarium tjaetaba]KAF5614119.1 hypothetical protein FTJAE_13769 [Fusarium tjaetaba]